MSSWAGLSLNIISPLDAIVSQALLKAVANKTSAGDSIPSSIQDRFHSLMEDAANILRRGLSAFSLRKHLQGSDAAADPTTTEKGKTASDDILPTIANVEVLEQLFDIERGVSSENQEICRFVRVATSFER